jgi:hypothetical protein
VSIEGFESIWGYPMLETIVSLFLMTYATDIINKTKSDFGDKAIDVFTILNEAIAKAEYLKVNRIIRCILFLAEKDVEKLKKMIETAKQDPRDVMYWAEYKKTEQQFHPIRIRDFNKTFDECEIDVKE